MIIENEPKQNAEESTAPVEASPIISAPLTLEEKKFKVRLVLIFFA